MDGDVLLKLIAVVAISLLAVVVIRHRLRVSRLRTAGGPGFETSDIFKMSGYAVAVDSAVSRIVVAKGKFAAVVGKQDIADIKVEQKIIANFNYVFADVDLKLKEVQNLHLEVIATKRMLRFAAQLRTLHRALSEEDGQASTESKLEDEVAALRVEVAKLTDAVSALGEVFAPLARRAALRHGGNS